MYVNQHLVEHTSYLKISNEQFQCLSFHLCFSDHLSVEWLFMNEMNMVNLKQTLALITLIVVQMSSTCSCANHGKWKSRF